MTAMLTNFDYLFMQELEGARKKTFGRLTPKCCLKPQGERSGNTTTTMQARQEHGETQAGTYPATGGGRTGIGLRGATG